MPNIKTSNRISAEINGPMIIFHLICDWLYPDTSLVCYMHGITNSQLKMFNRDKNYCRKAAEH